MARSLTAAFSAVGLAGTLRGDTPATAVTAGNLTMAREASDAAGIRLFPSVAQMRKIGAGAKY